MIQVEDFKPILDRYKVIFFDAFGVLKSYGGLVPGIEKTFAHIEAQNKEYYIVTNDASRSPVQLAEAYHRMGLHAIRHDRIVSSGMLAKEYLDLNVNDGIVAYLGTGNSAHYIDNSGLHTLPVSAINADNIDKVNALAFLDDDCGMLLKPGLQILHGTTPNLIACSMVIASDTFLTIWQLAK